MRFALLLGALPLASAQNLPVPVSARVSSSSQSSLSSSSSLSLNASTIARSSTIGQTSISSQTSSTLLSSGTVKSSTPASSSSRSIVTPTPPSSGYVNPWAGNSTGSAVYSNPWAGNFSGPLLPTGTGSAYALQCQNAWFSYTSINYDYPSVSASRFYVTSTIRNSTVYEVHTYYKTIYYTLCDGHPRVITSTPTATLTTTLQPSTTTYLVQGVNWDSYGVPNCAVNWDDCRGLWSRYYSASTVYNSISFAKANTVVQMGSDAKYWIVNGVTTTFPTPSPSTVSLGTEYIHKYYKSGQYLVVTTPPPGGIVCDCGQVMTVGGAPVTIQHTVDFTNTPYTPQCRTEKPTCTANQACQIGGDRVEIFWFPPQTNATRDMCATAPVGDGVVTRPPTNFTWTPITTGPYTVLPGNTTWFSGNIYVSLNRITANCVWSNSYVPVGGEHGGEILTMAPSELFSQRATPTVIGDRSGLLDFGPNAYSFNFDDLISPYPWSAWNGAVDCVRTSCSTISGSYNPWIAVPEAIRRMDPKWATCDLALYGLYDPPIALNTVGTMFATTTTPSNIGPSATPGQSPPQSQVEATNTPLKPGAPLPWQSESPKPEQPVVAPPAGALPSPTPNPSKPDDPAQVEPDPNNGSNQPVSKAPDGQLPNPQIPSDPDVDENNNNQNTPLPSSPPKSIPALAPVPVAAQPTTIGTIGSSPIVINPANPTQITIGPSIITPSGAGLTIGTGTSISFIDRSHLVISTPGAAAPSTINVPQPIGNGISAAPTPTAGAIITLSDGSRITATAIIGEGHSGARTATSILVSGTLFSLGSSPITLSNGIVLSEAPSGTGIIVINPSSGATSTLAFSSIPGIYKPALTTPVVTAAPTALLTLGGRVYTATSQSGSLVVPELGLTVSAGGAARTVNGTVISDGGSRTGVLVGGSTAVFSTPASLGTSGTGRGGASTVTIRPTKGGAAERRVDSWVAIGAAICAVLWSTRRL